MSSLLPGLPFTTQIVFMARVLDVSVRTHTAKIADASSSREEANQGSPPCLPLDPLFKKKRMKVGSKGLILITVFIQQVLSVLRSVLKTLP